MVCQFRRQFTHQLAIASFLLGSLLGTPALCNSLTENQIKQAQSVAGLKIELPDAGDKPITGLGLFIGVNKYPHIPKHDLAGCVNDAIGMHAVFSRRFKVSHASVLTNGQATYANIYEGLRGLMKFLAQMQRKPDERIPVVITYSGHGVQGANKKEEDGFDEFWMPNDARLVGNSIDSSKLIRDDVIQKICQFIASKGGHVVLISDSCHSGSIHRTADKVRSLDPRVVKRVTGPAQEFSDLFKEFTLRGSGSAGFVSFSACRDDQKARETKGRIGNGTDDHFGRLSLTMIQILSALPPQATYDEVAERIAVEFTNRRYRQQEPQYHKTGGKTDELFMTGGYAPPHAKMLNGDLQRGLGTFNVGQYHGVENGSQFKLFASLRDLASDENIIGTAVATDVQAMTTTVDIKSKSAVDRELVVAALDQVRFGDFKVYVHSDLPDTIHTLVAKMDGKKQIRIVTEAECDVGVYQIGDSDSIGIFPNESLPDSKSGRGGNPSQVIKNTSGHVVFDVGRALLRLARSDRFFSLDYPNTAIGVKIVPGKLKKNGDFEKLENTRRVDGVVRLTAGQVFRIDVTNQSKLDVYVYVFGSRVDGSLMQVYPDREDREHLPVKAMNSASIPSDAPFNALRSGEEEVLRGRSKIIVTTEPFNFRSLLLEPDVGDAAKRSAGPSHQLGRFVDALLAGSPSTRSSTQRIANWAARTLVFDIERRESK